MAEGKKSFVLYSDMLQSIEHLTNEEKGILFNHLLEYVNDLKPILTDRLILTAWKPIELSLKRDLVKFEEVKIKRSDAGKKSAELRALKSQEQNATNATNSTSVESVEQVPTNPTDSVNVSVSVNDNVSVNDILLKKETKKSLLSEIKISDLEINEIQYFEIALAYQKLFIKNLKEKNAPAANQEKATYKNYVTPIRLMMSSDGVTKEQLTLVYKYLGSVEGEFWKSNILSTSKLREKFQQLLLKSQENGKSGNYKSGNTTPTTDELAEQSYSAVAKLLGRTQ